ncbi:hypothetical protein chiPu_0020525, partial [Chiloscyllium punctatum]|nr:hypothetical protein [Chiloscyllium punctatum]
ESGLNAVPINRRVSFYLCVGCRSLLAGIDLDLGQVDISDWDHRLPPAAKKEIVQNLPTVPVTPAQADKGLKCPVCLLEFEEEEKVKKMPCEHFFHSGCLVPWLGKERRKQKEHRLEYLHGAMYT